MDTINTALHEATLLLLERTGVRISSPSVLDLFTTHGVRVNNKQKTVHPTAQDVVQALNTIPRSFEVYGRRTENPLLLGGENAYILSGGASLRVLTLDGRYESATWGHLHQFNTLLDALPYVHMCINQVDPQNGGQGFYKQLAAEMLVGLPKPPFFQANNADDVFAMHAMGVALRGSPEALAAKPVFMVGGNAEPPLDIPGHVAELIVAACQADIPTSLGNYNMLGITAPITVAGSVVQLNAVQLVTIVLSQLVRPGARLLYTAFSGGGNMRTLDPVTSDVRTLQMLRLAAGLGRSYGLPIYSVASTDARQPDPQAACERALQLQMAVECGANLIQGPTSMMDQMMLSSLAQAVIDNDIAGLVLNARQRPEISSETLALDVIQEVATDPAFKDLKFAAHEHTVRHLHDVPWHPQTFGSDSFATWQAKGSPTVVQQATAIARDILEHHHPEPLPLTVAKEIRQIAMRNL